MAEFDPKTARKVPGIGEFDPSTAQPYEPPKPASALRRVGDLGVKLGQGVAARIPEMVIGAGSMLTGGKTGYVAQSLGFDTKKIREGIGQYLTPEQQADDKAVQQAEGFIPTIKAVVQNPMAAVGAVAESIPVMVAGGMLGRAVAPGRFAGAVGEGAAMAGSQAEQIRQQTSDGLLTGKQSLIAAGTGLVGGALGAVGSKVAGRFGVGDVDSMIANGFKTGTQAAVKPGVRGLAERMVKGGISEGLFEEMPQSMVETGLQNYALGKDVTDGMGNAAAMGLVTGGLMGAGAGALTRGAKETPPADPTQPPMDPTQPAQGPQGEVLGLPAPAIVVGSDGTAQTAADRNARLQRMQSGDIVDVTPIRETMRPSVAMGINPADGPLSKAAAMAVDSGASPVVDPLTDAPVVQARNAQPQGVDPQALSSMSDTDLRGYMRNAQDTSIRKAVSAELAKRKQAAVDAMPDPLQASVFDQPQGATNRGIETDQTQQAETQREAQDATRQGIGAGLTNPIVQGAQDDRIAATGVQRTDDRGNRDGRGDAGTSLPAGMGDAAAPDRRLASADAELDTQGDAGDRPSGRTTGNPASLTPGNFTAQPTARMGEMTRATAGPGFTAADVMRPAASAEPITATNGDPFPSQLAAKRELNKQGLTNTHAITPAGEGFVLTPNNVQDQQKGTDGILSAETPQAAPVEAPAPAGRDAAAIGGVPATPGAGDVQADGVTPKMGDTEKAVSPEVSPKMGEGAKSQADGVTADVPEVDFGNMTPDQRKRARLEQEIATGKTNNGGVIASLRPSAIEKRKQELAQMGDAGRLSDLSKTQPKIDTPAAPAQGAATSEQVKKPPYASKEDVEHLFGVPQKRQAAIDRIAKGTAYFGTPEKAKDFIAKSGIKDTHEAVAVKPGRFEVRAKATNPAANPGQSTTTPVNESLADRRKRATAEREAEPKKSFADMVQDAKDAVPGYKGKNTDGEIVYEDARGVRSILRDGVRITESVAMRPTRDGVKIAVEHKGEFLTAEEAKAAQSTRQGPRLQPGEPGYTLEMAEQDLKTLRANPGASGRVEDSRVTERITRQEKLIADMKAEAGTAAWDGMNEDSKKQILLRAGWTTGKGELNFVGKNLMKRPWSDIGEGTRATIDKFREPAAAEPADAPEQQARPAPSRDDPLFEQKNQLRQLQNTLDAGVDPQGGPLRADRRASYEKSIKDLQAEIERVVKVPPAVTEAMTGQMQKQKNRIARLKREAEANGMTLDEKRQAHTKVKAAETTLRKMRTSVFDAEDAAVKAVESKDASAFSEYADLFPDADAAIKVLTGQNDELDAEMQAYESGLTANTRANDKQKVADAKPAAQTPAQLTLNEMLDPDKAPSLNALDAATHDVDVGFLKRLHDQLRATDAPSDKAAKDRRQSRIGYLLAAIQAKETGKGGIGTKPAAPTPTANTIFTEDAAAAARARLKAKLGRLNSGLDPEMMMDGITLAGYHIEKGARTFAAYARAMVADLGDGVKPYLQSWYMAVRADPRATQFKSDMDKASTVEDLDVDVVLAANPAQPTAVESDSTSTPTAKTLTESLYQAITAGNMPKDNPALKKLVEAFDGKPADQARMKQGQEELETAIAMAARDVVAKNEGDRTTFDILLRMYERQPNLNIRTSTSVANQAYSTPAPLAFLASRLAGITKATVAHEPTGGTGMLLIGADPKKAIVNELNDLRIEALKAQGFNPTQKDAATQQLVPTGTQPDAVVTNPPFGSIKDADGKPVKVKVDGFSLGQIDHLIAARALDTMKDDGRATLILGANKVAGGLSTDDRIFFNWLYSHYNVVGHFEVEGDLYNRQGAGWPVRVITINGRQKSDKFSPVAGTIQRVDNWDSVYEQFTQSLNSAKAPRSRATPGAASAGVATPATGAAPSPVGGKKPEGSTRGAGNVAGASPGVVPDRAKPAVEPVGGVADEQRINAQSHVPQPQPGQNPAGSTRSEKPAGTAAVSEAQGNEFQAPYTPRSSRKDEGVLIPANMAQPTQDALSRLEDEVGDIDEFARKELGYDTVADLHNALMGLQVDSVATSIYQIKQGKAVVIADQTGIGKGRQAASIIRWAARQGMTPVFVSVKPSLFTDMYGDLADIGTNDVTPFIMNSDAWVAGDGGTKLFANKPSGHKNTIQGIANSGQLPDGSNAMFMTYSQINQANVQRQALMALAPNAVFVLDESHNAAGASSTGEFVIGALEAAKGVVYLSATYAKRPDNMPLYFKTDIGNAAADAEGLAMAMAAGGLPLQTVVSNNLVKAGQMFRRERSYDGVSIASVFDTPNRALHERMSNEATKALRAIVSADRMFHEVYVKELADELAQSGATVQDSAGNQIEQGVQHTEFSSVVHNFVKQMLLGLKAQSAADEAIASLKRGEKPIIAVENTMGSFLNEYAASNAIAQGESLGTFDYRTVLSRALARSRVVIEVAPNGDKIKRQVAMSQLDRQTQKAYEDAQAVIDGLTLSIPVSPIDWMRAEITRAGFKVAEITGRNLSVDYGDPKKPVLSAIDATEQKDKVNTTRQFNSGNLDALILNVAGSTGISLHASEKFEDQRQRHMIVAQAAGDINIFMQMLGRVHRTGQVRLPKYTILSVDLPTEKRPTAVLSIKMKSLNANTSSNTESATSVKSSDILNKYGDQIVNQYLQDNYALARALGLESEIGEDPSEDIARKATGRLALQPIETQHAFYDDVEAQYTALIDYLNKTNQNDLEPRTFDFDAKETREEVLFEGQDKSTPFGEDAIYGEYSIKAQGTPMKPEEIRATMAENLGELSPAAHMQQMQDDLDAKYKAYVLGLAKDSNDSMALANSIETYNAQAHAAVGDALLANASIKAASQARDAGRDFLSSHKIGSTFRVEINSESFNAVVLNVRNTHKETGNPYSLSKIQVSVAVNGALRSLSVPATQFKKIEVSGIAPSFRVEQLFKEQPPNQRETAKIITGNLLAAYGEMQGVRGTIINFTKQDGTVDQGILLPKLFDYSKNTRGDYRLVDGDAALKFLQQSENKDIGRFGIMSRDGNVRVLPAGQGIRVQVPKSKLKGAKYFLDKGLIEVGGDFVTQGNFMVSSVYAPADAVKMLDLLMKKQALYALPSMADEAKQLTGDKANPEGDATLSIVDEAGKAGDTADYGSATQAHRNAAARFSAAFGERLAGGPDPDLLDAVAPRESTKRGRSLASVAAVAERLFNREVVFVRFKGKPKFNGAVSKSAPGFIFLNIDSQKPLMAVLGHELLHEMAKSQPSMYANLSRRLDGLIKGETEYGKRLVDQYRKQGISLKGLDAREELEADIVGDNFMDGEFWNALAEKQPGMFRRIVNFVTQWLDTQVDKLTGYRPFGTDEFLTDIAEARAAVADAMRQFSAAEVGAVADPVDGDVKFSAAGKRVREETAFSLADAAPNDSRDIAKSARQLLQDTFKAPGKLNWWHKTVGTQWNLAQRVPEFKRVFDAAQDFLDDVSHYGAEASKLAPKIIPKLETWKDLGKSPISAEDNKAISAPIFEGTLTWGRDESGKPVKMADLEAQAAALSPEQKGQRLLRQGKISEGVLKMWKGLPADQFSAAIETRYASEMLKAGVVWSDAELKSIFKMTDGQIKLYREFRAATDKSLTDLAVADILQFAGKDVDPIKDAVLGQPLNDGAEMVRDYLLSLAEMFPERADTLIDTANRVIDKADRATDLMERGYAPLARFGRHTVYVTSGEEQLYFGMYENRWEAAKAERNLRETYPNAVIDRGVMSVEAYKQFQGISPETLELFGEMLGLESDGDSAENKAFQTYLKLAKSNRSAMKRHIERKGVAGFSEDAGRVLATFIYSNARQASSYLHTGEIMQGVRAIPKGMGDVQDAAQKLASYIMDPQEEAQAIRGLLFAQYLGGSIASAMVNALQPAQVTFPYLSQFVGIRRSAAIMKNAVQDALKKSTGDTKLDAALLKAEEDGIVSPQEIHQLMAQAQGKATLRPGDGTRAGDAMATASNTLARLSTGWGKVFSVAEQFNRRTTFIAAYRAAVEKGLGNPAAFAEKAVQETQFVYNKGNKPAWARGAVGGTLFTFKQYSISYVELLSRTAASGPEGRKAAALMLGVLFLMAGAGGMPGAEDLEDVIDGIAQRVLGLNWQTRQKREEWLTSMFGAGAARFVENGLSGLPWSPTDVSGRLGLGNLIPGTGVFVKKSSYGRDVAEIAGPAGDFARRIAEGAGHLLSGNVMKAAETVSPVAVRNAVIGARMGVNGQYDDASGKKVVDTEIQDAALKAIGFQPYNVARVQDATRQVRQMVVLNTMRESEIADKWAKAIANEDPDGVKDARNELAEWNQANPDAPIRITVAQIRSRVRALKEDKATRMERTSPKEIRAQVARELAGVR